MGGGVGDTVVSMEDALKRNTSSIRPKINIDENKEAHVKISHWRHWRLYGVYTIAGDEISDSVETKFVRGKLADKKSINESVDNIVKLCS